MTDTVCYKLSASCLDILDDLQLEFEPYLTTMQSYRDANWPDEPICRLMMPYPMASEHTAKISRPEFYTEALDGKTVETDDYTAYTIRNYVGHPNNLIFMKDQHARSIGPSVNTLIERIKADPNGPGDSLSVTQMCLSWKDPGFLLKQHKDTMQPWFTASTRYHCVIKSNPDNKFYSGDDPDNMNEYVATAGEIWALDVAQFHKTCNNSTTEDSLHIIIDFFS